jgi:hypothetical protein
MCNKTESLNDITKIYEQASKDFISKENGLLVKEKTNL